MSSISLRRRAAAVLTTLLAFAGCAREPASEEAAGPAARDAGPRLLVLLVVDQFAWDYIGRFDPFLRGGLRRLLDEGALFTEAYYDHATTETAPGHTTLATGVHPSSSGIIGNNWVDRASGSPVYSFEDPHHGRSPLNLRADGLGDWIKAFDPASKVFTLSTKDRSAIAMGGHAADAAYWFDTTTGEFTTSTYYPHGVPEWLVAFNGRRLADVRFGKAWEPLPLSDADLERLHIVERDEGWQENRFPHALGGLALAPDPAYWSAFAFTPFGDEQLLELARAAIAGEQLGQREHLDYLAIGLSALDGIGHSFGPDSREAADVILRLDDLLDRFLDDLDASVGLDRVLLALSADHGVPSPPEVRKFLGLDGRRADDEDFLCFQQAGRRVAERHHLDKMVLRGLYLDRDAITSAGVEPAAVEEELARELESCPVVERVWTSAELAATRADEPELFRRLFRHSFDPDRSPDLELQLHPYDLASGTWATHGSPYEYDRHVPLLIRLPGTAGARLTEPVGIVDLAPTLASLLGIDVTAPIDGHDLRPLIEGALGRLPDLTAYQAGVPKESP